MSPDQAFKAYERFVTSANEVDVSVNTDKTKILQPAGQPSQLTLQKARELDLSVVEGNIKHLGAMVGTDQQGLRDFVQASLKKHDLILEAISHRSCPAQLALQLARVCALPKPNYLMRAMPSYATQEAMSSFDQRLQKAISTRLNLPPLRDSALLTLQQPIRNGGIGFRPMEMAVPAAAWSAYVQSAKDTQPFIIRAAQANRVLPFANDRTSCYNRLVNDGCPATDPNHSDAEPDDDDWHMLPHDPARIVEHYEKTDPNSFRLQRLLTASMEDRVFRRFIDSCNQEDRARLNSCQLKYTGLWLIVPISSPVSCLTDVELSIALRLRMGLSPAPRERMPTVCECGHQSINDHWHAFSCIKLRRLAVTWRHDRLLKLFAGFVRGNCSIHVEQSDPSGKRPDACVHLYLRSILTDVSITHPNAPSIRRNAASAPGRAAEIRATSKTNKYATEARNAGQEFLALVLETYGGYSKSALKLLKNIAMEGSNPLLGCSNPYAMSKSRFLRLASICLQRNNARIVVQWMHRALNSSSSRHFLSISR